MCDNIISIREILADADVFYMVDYLRKNHLHLMQYGLDYYTDTDALSKFIGDESVDAPLKNLQDTLKGFIKEGLRTHYDR